MSEAAVDPGFKDDHFVNAQLQDLISLAFLDCQTVEFDLREVVHNGQKIAENREKRITSEKSSATRKVRTKGSVNLNYVFYRVVRRVGSSNGF